MSSKGKDSEEQAAFMLQFWNEAVSDVDEAYELLSESPEESFQIVMGIPQQFWGKPFEILCSINPSLRTKMQELWAMYELTLQLIAFESNKKTLGRRVKSENPKTYTNSNKRAIVGVSKGQITTPFALVPMLQSNDSLADGPITGRPQAIPFSHVKCGADGWGAWMAYGENDLAPESKRRWVVKTHQ